MREADVAIRLRQPTQPDLIQRKLFSVHFHVYASPEYLKRFGTPRNLEDLDSHRILVLGGNIPSYLQRSRWLIEVARDGKGPRVPHLVINNILGILRACQRGLGIAMLPDYLVEENGGLVQLFGEADAIALDAYFATFSSPMRSAGISSAERLHRDMLTREFSCRNSSRAPAKSIRIREFYATATAWPCSLRSPHG
jgi:DNA-binding transcriptional LysR family regulator